jgi:hypothetical protein
MNISIMLKTFICSAMPNKSFQGTKTRALRGFCPLNSSR